MAAIDKVIAKIAAPLTGRTAPAVREANAARDSGRWAEASALFAAVAETKTGRDDLWVQAGNCAKEAGQRGSALAFYQKVRAPTVIGDAAFQAGVLFRDAGNPYAARALFKQANLAGHGLARLEMARLAQFAFSSVKGEPVAAWRRQLILAESKPADFAALLAAESGLRERSPLAAQTLLQLATLHIGTSPGRRGSLALMGLSDLPLSQGVSDTSKATILDTVQAHIERLADSWDGTLAVDIPQTPRKTGTFTLGAERVPADGADRLANVSQLLADLNRTLFAGDPDALVHAAGGFVKGVTEIFPLPLTSVADSPALEAEAAPVATVANISLSLAQRLSNALGRVAGDPGLFAALFDLETEAANAALGSHGDILGGDLWYEPVETVLPRPEISSTAAWTTRVLAPYAPDTALQLAAGRLGMFPGLWDEMNARAFADGALDDRRLRDAAEQFLRAGEWDLARQLIQSTPGYIAKEIPSLLMHAQICKTMGAYQEAYDQLIRTLALQPDDANVMRELIMVVPEVLSPLQIHDLFEQHPALGEAAKSRSTYGHITSASASIADEPASYHNERPQPVSTDFGSERIDLQQVGWQKAVFSGETYPMLTGVVSVRVKAVTSKPVSGMRVRLNGRSSDWTAGSHAGVDAVGRYLTYFNSWLDLSGLSNGFRELQATVEMRDSGYMSREVIVYVNNSVESDAFLESDSFVFLAPENENDTTPAQARISALPSMLRSSSRSALARRPERVLVMRLDQLGDVSASLPAVRRLREQLPDAIFTGLVTPANRELLESTGFFDEIETVAFPYDHTTRRRHISSLDESLLKRRLQQRTFDLAVDLSPGDDSRPILLLSNAKYYAGFKPHKFPFLHFGVEVVTRDGVNRKEATSHTTMISGFVEALCVALSGAPARIAPGVGAAEAIVKHGLVPQGFVALHTGARLAIKRWPRERFEALAELCLDRLGMPVVILYDDPLPEAETARLREIPDLIVIEGRVPFAELDGILGLAAVVVGNDTGPKHLASVRGTPVVSVHMCQVNWNEWGQDGPGMIVSRRTPCCGCGIEDPLECGRDLICLTDISAEDVFRAVEITLNQNKVALDA